MIKTLVSILAITVFFSVSPSAMAMEPDKTIEYEGGTLGKVVFSGKTHAEAKLACTDCHEGIFKQSRYTFHMTSRDHIKDNFCAVCHNGKRAFGSRDVHSCDRCHQKD